MVTDSAPMPVGAGSASPKKVGPVTLSTSSAQRAPSGMRLIRVYLTLAYVIPGILFAIIPPPDGLYRIVSVNWLPVSLLLATIALYFAIGSAGRRGMRVATAQYEFRFIPPLLELVILVVLVAIGAAGYLEGLTDWRYREASLSEALSPLAIAFALAPVGLHFLLLVNLFFKRETDAPGGFVEPLKRILLAVGFLLAANGTRTFLVAAMSVAFVFFPRSLRGLLFVDVTTLRKKGTRRVALRFGQVLLAALFASAVPVAWFLGESVKRNDLTVDIIGDLLDIGSPASIITFKAWNWSPTYASARVAIADYELSSDWSVVPNYFLAPIGSFAFRANRLVQAAVAIPRPDEGSVARINYTMVSADPVNPREGTSPGLIAGFLFCLPFPLNLVALVAYMLALQRFLTRLADGSVGRLTVLGQVLFLLFVLPALFESPIDLGLVLDDANASLLLLFLLRNVAIRLTPVEAPKTLRLDSAVFAT
jgi:hypothetical protein